MAKQYKVRIKLLKNDGPCNQGLKPGTEWLIDDQSPKGLCYFAYSALRPFIEVLKNGGTIPWEPDPNIVVQCCPDHLVNNVFEMRRVPESDERSGVYDVNVTMIGKECEGTCSFGHKEGDSWNFKGHSEMIRGNICPSARQAFADALFVMRCGGQYPWQEDPDTYTISCPDPNVRNQFQLKRTPRKMPGAPE